MKNLGFNIRRNAILIQKEAFKVASNWLKTLKNDLNFYQKYTELLAIWTILFSTITGLFIFAINSNLLIMLLSLIAGFLIMLVGSLATIRYLYNLKYGNKKSLSFRIHNLLNKSFKLRNLFGGIKLPRISFTSFARNLKLAS